MAHHVAAENGCTAKIVVSWADLSVWCYPCESYVSSESVQEVLGKLHKSKFGVEIGEEVITVQGLRGKTESGGATIVMVGDQKGQAGSSSLKRCNDDKGGPSSK